MLHGVSVQPLPKTESAPQQHCPEQHAPGLVRKQFWSVVRHWRFSKAAASGSVTAAARPVVRSRVVRMVVRCMFKLEVYCGDE